MTDDSLIVYGARCAWWDSIDKAGSIPREAGAPGLPCCPHCKGVLYQVEADGWFGGLKRYEKESGIPGYEAMWLWSRGQCFPDPEALARAYENHRVMTAATPAQDTPPPAPSKVVAMVPCNRIGCPAAATVAFKTFVPAKGFSLDQHQPLTSILGIKVCQKHYDEDEEGFFDRNPTLKEAIEAGLEAMGRAAPDWDRAWVKPVPITSPEFLQFEAMAKGNSQ